MFVTFLKLSSFYHSWRFLVISGLFLFEMTLSCRNMLRCNCVRTFISDALSCVICRSDTAVTELLCRWIFLRVCPCGVWVVCEWCVLCSRSWCWNNRAHTVQKGCQTDDSLNGWLAARPSRFWTSIFVFFPPQTFMNSCCVDHLKCFKSVKINACFRKCVSKGFTSWIRALWKLSLWKVWKLCMDF